MTRDELEFSISQYLDGTLAEPARGALETHLGGDAEARAIYAEYESLQRAMVAAPLPAVNWNNFAAHLSAAVSREELPATSYKIKQWFRPMRLAAAASVLLAIGAGIAVLSSSQNHNGSGTTIATKAVSIVKIDSADAGRLSSEPVRIAVGPPADALDEPIAVRFADSVVQRPSKALIVSAAPAAQDSSLAPF